MNLKKTIYKLVLVCILASCFGCSSSNNNFSTLDNTKNETNISAPQNQSTNSSLTKDQIDEINKKNEKHFYDDRDKSDKMKVLQVFNEIIKIANGVKEKYPNQIMEWKPIEKEIHNQINRLDNNLTNTSLLAKFSADFSRQKSFATEQEVYIETFLECVRILAKNKGIGWVKSELEILRERISGSAHTSEEFYGIVEGIDIH